MPPDPSNTMSNDQVLIVVSRARTRAIAMLYLTEPGDSLAIATGDLPLMSRSLCAGSIDTKFFVRVRP